jgi:hypothetical protein
VNKAEFLDECQRVAIEFNTMRKAEGSTVDLTRGYYAKVGASAWSTIWQAIEDKRSDTRVMRVVTAAAGSGKTTHAEVAALALARLGGTTLLVVNQIDKADKVYQEMAALLPGKVAVWTREHDPAQKVTADKRKLDDGPSAMFTQDELAQYPIAIVTAKMVENVNAHKATAGRTVTMFDERPDMIKLHTVSRAQILEARDASKALDFPAAGIEALAQLYKIVDRDKIDGPDLEKPSYADIEQLPLLRWFRTDEAKRLARVHGETAHIAAVLGYGRCFSGGYAIMARSYRRVRYTGYETAMDAEPGAVLLDASGRIDGLSALRLDWRDVVPMPKSSYSNLKLVTVPPLTPQRLKTFLNTAKGIKAYMVWMHKVIEANMPVPTGAWQSGQRGLVICRKDLVTHGNVPCDQHAWGKGWDLDGRQLYVTWWGDGIGFNTWADARVVFLFDQFYIPKDAVIATANGYREAKAEDGPSGTMAKLTSPQEDVDALWTGHLLRWDLQMALRGNARNFTADGVCGEQTLVWAANPGLLQEHWPSLFPGTQQPVPMEPITVPDGPALPKLRYPERVLSVVTRPGLPDTMSTAWLADEAKVPRRALTCDVLPLGRVQRVLAAYGFRYTAGKGQQGASIVRA